MLTPKYTLPVILFQLLSLFLSGQDSLKIMYKKMLDESSHDTTKISLYIKLAKIGGGNEIIYANKALDLAKKIQAPSYTVKALCNLSDTYYKNGEQTTGLKFIDQAMHIVNEQPGRENLDLVLWTKIPIEFGRVHLDSSEKECKKLLSITSNDMYKTDAYGWLGSIHHYNEKYKEAIEAYIKAREVARINNDSFGEASALYYLSTIYIKFGFIDKAEKYTDECIKIVESNGVKNMLLGYKNKALVLIEKGKFKEALEILENTQEKIKQTNINYLSENYKIQGHAYFDSGDYNSAFTKYMKAIDVEREQGRKMVSPECFMRLAEIYVHRNEIEKAERCLDSVNGFSGYTVMANKKGLYRIKSLIYNRKGNFEKAYNSYVNYVKITDSLDAHNRKHEAYILEAEYQSAKKEQEIATLNAENQIKTLHFSLAVGSGVLVLLFLGFVYYRFIMSIKTKARLVELDKAKSRFFANISHEFRTPLSLMMGPIQQKMYLANNDSEKQEFMMMYNNGERLRKLIDQLLDLSKIEAKDMPLKTQKTDIVETTKILYSFFITRAEEKNIEYNISFPKEGREGYIDRDKLEKIVINLLSNAFKFTPEGGKIDVSLTVGNEKLILVIEDTGIGIPADKISHIFNRFYQVDDSVTRASEGSGIGLALSKELAVLHKGDLSAKSECGKGSIFTLCIPVSKQAYKKDQIINPAQEGFLEDKNVIRQLPVVNPVFDKKSKKPWVLVVEDNPDMRSFIYSILKKDYEVILAANGTEAYEKAIEMIPDIIVSDYMMPEMDGLTLCKKIKSHELIQHIPFVMLTAKAGQESKLHGLEHGADFYLTKPFDNNELLLIIQNIIDQQKKLKEHFSKHYGQNLIPEVPVREKEFIEKMNKIFENKYHDTDYGIDQLALDLCLSRMQLHRKIKSITGNSPGCMLRSFRINKAIHLLCNSSLSIGEVAYIAGFKNQSSFTKTFKDLTGKTPSEYMAIHI